MKIALITAQDPQHTLTGVAAYVCGLTRALADLGHEVHHVWTGRRNFHEVERRIRQVDPHLIHVHDVCALPPAFMDVFEPLGRPVVVTLHDFWAFCRRWVLVRIDLRSCDGSAGGHNCARVCGLVDPSGRLDRLVAHLPASAREQVRPALQSVAGLYRALRGAGSSQFAIRSVLGKGELPVGAPSLQAYFAEREAAYRASLLKASALLAVSEFTKRMYVAHGYPPERIEVLPIATPALERIRWHLRKFQGYPVRFGFVGRVSPFKGAHVLAEAIRGIPPGVAEFHFFGAVRPEDWRYLTALAGGHPDVRFHGAYAQADLPDVLDRCDVLIFPSIQQETVGLVGLEAQAAGLPIIGSRVGAIPEYVRHEVNGLLFEVGDALSLRAQITRILDHPELIETFSANVSPPRTMAEHVTNLVSVYRRVTQPRTPLLA